MNRCDTPKSSASTPPSSGVLTVLNQPELVRICRKFRLSALKLVWFYFLSVVFPESLTVVIITKKKKMDVLNAV